MKSIVFTRKVSKESFSSDTKKLRQNLSSFNLNQFQDHQYKVGSKYHLVP